MIRRPTWIVLAVFVVLLGVTFYLQRNPISKADATPTAAVSLLFDIPAERNVQDVKITGSPGKAVEVAYQTDGSWRLLGTVEAPADTARVEQAINQLRNTQVLATLKTPLDPETAGLQPPAYLVSFTLDDGTLLSVSIGDLNPTGSGYYAQREGMPMQVVSKSSVDAVVNLLTSPPYLPTATPPATSLPGPQLTPEGTPTGTP